MFPSTNAPNLAGGCTTSSSSSFSNLPHQPPILNTSPDDIISSHFEKQKEYDESRRAVAGRRPSVGQEDEALGVQAELEKSSGATSRTSSGPTGGGGTRTSNRHKTKSDTTPYYQDLLLTFAFYKAFQPEHAWKAFSRQCSKVAATDLVDVLRKYKNSNTEDSPSTTTTTFTSEDFFADLSDIVDKNQIPLFNEVTVNSEELITGLHEEFYHTQEREDFSFSEEENEDDKNIPTKVKNGAGGRANSNITRPTSTTTTVKIPWIEALYESVEKIQLLRTHLITVESDTNWNLAVEEENLKMFYQIEKLKDVDESDKSRSTTYEAPRSILHTVADIVLKVDKNLEGVEKADEKNHTILDFYHLVSLMKETDLQTNWLPMVLGYGTELSTAVEKKDPRISLNGFCNSLVGYWSLNMPFLTRRDLLAKMEVYHSEQMNNSGAPCSSPGGASGTGSTTIPGSTFQQIVLAESVSVNDLADPIEAVAKFPNLLSEFNNVVLEEVEQEVAGLSVTDVEKMERKKKSKSPKNGSKNSVTGGSTTSRKSSRSSTSSAPGKAVLKVPIGKYLLPTARASSPSSQQRPPLGGQVEVQAGRAISSGTVADFPGSSPSRSPNNKPKLKPSPTFVEDTGFHSMVHTGHANMAALMVFERLRAKQTARYKRGTSEELTLSGEASGLKSVKERASVENYENLPASSVEEFIGEQQASTGRARSKQLLPVEQNYTTSGWAGGVVTAANPPSPVISSPSSSNSGRRRDPERFQEGRHRGELASKTSSDHVEDDVDENKLLVEDQDVEVLDDDETSFADSRCGFPRLRIVGGHGFQSSCEGPKFDDRSLYERWLQQEQKEVTTDPIAGVEMVNNLDAITGDDRDGESESDSNEAPLEEDPVIHLEHGLVLSESELLLSDNFEQQENFEDLQEWTSWASLSARQDKKYETKPDDDMYYAHEKINDIFDARDAGLFIPNESHAEPVQHYFSEGHHGASRDASSKTSKTGSSPDSAPGGQQRARSRPPLAGPEAARLDAFLNADEQDHISNLLEQTRRRLVRPEGDVTASDAVGSYFSPTSRRSNSNVLDRNSRRITPGAAQLQVPEGERGVSQVLSSGRLGGSSSENVVVSRDESSRNGEKTTSGDKSTGNFYHQSKINPTPPQQHLVLKYDEEEFNHVRCEIVKQHSKPTGALITPNFDNDPNLIRLQLSLSIDPKLYTIPDFLLDFGLKQGPTVMVEKLLSEQTANELLQSVTFKDRYLDAEDAYYERLRKDCLKYKGMLGGVGEMKNTTSSKMKTNARAFKKLSLTPHHRKVICGKTAKIGMRVRRGVDWFCGRNVTTVLGSISSEQSGGREDPVGADVGLAATPAGGATTSSKRNKASRSSGAMAAKINRPLLPPFHFDPSPAFPSAGPFAAFVHEFETSDRNPNKSFPVYSCGNHLKNHFDHTLPEQKDQYLFDDTKTIGEQFPKVDGSDLPDAAFGEYYTGVIVGIDEKNLTCRVEYGYDGFFGAVYAEVFDGYRIGKDGKYDLGIWFPGEEKTDEDDRRAAAAGEK
ncbi:unnamed protein product [Amoebophrya sp. A120]|nr:unnamed protein product [Amoebophrya sp. A120]|eukprot:GSA120T00013805001.1